MGLRTRILIGNVSHVRSVRADTRFAVPITNPDPPISAVRGRDELRSMDNEHTHNGGVDSVRINEATTIIDI
jgi:hypothetical protein